MMAKQAGKTGHKVVEETLRERAAVRFRAALQKSATPACVYLYGTCFDVGTVEHVEGHPYTMADRIRVTVRSRPLNAREEAQGIAWSCDSTSISLLNPDNQRSTGTTYTFGTNICLIHRCAGAHIRSLLPKTTISDKFALLFPCISDAQTESTAKTKLPMRCTRIPLRTSSFQR